MDVFEGSTKRCRNQLTKFYEYCEFCKLKCRALSRDPSGDRMMLRAEVRVRVQVSHGNFTVLSVAFLRMFARKFSHIEFFLKILP